MGVGPKGLAKKAKLWEDYLEAYGEPPEIPPSDYAARKFYKETVDAAPAREEGPPRRIVEFCCADDSALGRARNSGCCEVTRITRDDDATTEYGKEKTLNAVRTKKRCLLWGAILCTGGCPRHYMNPHRNTTAFKQRQKDVVSSAMKMFDTFVAAAHENRARGGKVAFEWPANNSYWHHPKVKKFSKEF